MQIAHFDMAVALKANDFDIVTEVNRDNYPE
jgi:hypothetical protein